MSQKHLAWLRTLGCCIDDGACSGPIHAHHVRQGTGGGMGKKPGSEWCVPICAAHHMRGHQVGWRTFEVEHVVDLLAMAGQFAAMSPFLTGPNQTDNQRRASVL